MPESKVEPIVMDNEGEALVPILKAGSVAARVFDNEDLLKEPIVGCHQFCGANMLKRNVSKTHFAIFCARCSLRVTVPKTVATYGDLREHFKLLRGDY